MSPKALLLRCSRHFWLHVLSLRIPIDVRSFRRDAGRRTGIKPDGTEEQIIRNLKEHEAGVPVADLSAASTASATPA